MSRLRRALTAFVTDEPSVEDPVPPTGSAGLLEAAHGLSRIWPVVAFAALVVPVFWLAMSTGYDANQVVAVGQHVSLYQLLDDFAPVMVMPVVAGLAFGLEVVPVASGKRPLTRGLVVAFIAVVGFLWLMGRVYGSGYLALATLALTLAILIGRPALARSPGENLRRRKARIGVAALLGMAGLYGLMDVPGIFPAASITTTETAVNGRVVDVQAGRVWALVDTDPKKGALSINLALLPGTVETIEYCGLPSNRVLTNPGECFTTTDLVGPDPSP